MSITQIIAIALSIAAAVIIIILLWRLGKKNQAKKEEQEKVVAEAAQHVTMLVIDKKKLRLKESGLPPQAINNVPWYNRRAKVAIVKAKIGPKILIMITDDDIFDLIPVKKEVRATISGLYITDVRGLRSQLDKPVKKERGFFGKMIGLK